MCFSKWSWFHQSKNIVYILEDLRFEWTRTIGIEVHIDEGKTMFDNMSKGKN